MKSNKLISFVLLLGLFMFFMEAEDRISSRFKDLSGKHLQLDSIGSKGQKILFQLVGKAPKDEINSEKFLSYQN